MDGRRGILLGVLLALCMMMGPAAGCRARTPPSGSTQGCAEIPDRATPSLLEQGLTGWQPQAPPDVAEGLEGLYRLVNGAADSYWAQGVRRASFQEWEPRADEGLLEVQQFAFRSTADAGRFFEQACREEGGVVRGDDALAACLGPGEAPGTAILWKGKDLTVVQLYGRPSSNPIEGLVRAFLPAAGPGW